MWLSILTLLALCVTLVASTGLVSATRTAARLTDTAVVTGNTFSTGTWCEVTDMYVWDVQFETNLTGGTNPKHKIRIAVDVYSDSDGDCDAEALDGPLNETEVTFELRDDQGAVIVAVSGKTNNNGTYRTGWLTIPGAGTYGGFVTEMTLNGYTWDPTMDRANPSYIVVGA